MRIMIVEDDSNVREELRALLESAGYEADAVSEFDRVSEQITDSKPDLVLLDVKLPGNGGLEICKELRRSLDVPVIFVTSGSEVMDEISGMLAGGDDYITKPYHPALLLVRIAAVLKRAAKKDAEEISAFTHKNVTLDIRSYKLRHMGREADLTKNECKLLFCMFSRKGEFIPRLDLTEYLWDNEVFIDDNALSITVARIRAKLDEIGVSGFIETKRGAGYRI